MNVLFRHLLIGSVVAACSLGAFAETAAQSMASADRLWAEGRLDDAQKAFEAAVASEPSSPELRLRLAGFQLSRQQTTECIANYQKVISQEPRNSKAWIGLGLAYLHSSRAALARAAFEEAVRVDPARKEALAPLIARLDDRKA